MTVNLEHSTHNAMTIKRDRILNENRVHAEAVTRALTQARDYALRLNAERIRVSEQINQLQREASLLNALIDELDAAANPTASPA